MESTRDSLALNIDTYQVDTIALTYQEQGLAVIDLPIGSKNPNRAGWQNEKLTEEDIKHRFSEPKNIGVLLGEPSSSRVDIDIDIPSLGLVAHLLLPKTDFVFGRESKPMSHWEYDIVGDLPKSETFVDPETKQMIVEVRASGQTVYPGSIHESGEQIKLYKLGDAGKHDRESVRNGAAQLASTYLISKTWNEGSRHDKALKLAGALVRAGYTEDEIATFIKTVCEIAGDDEVEDRLRAVEDTVQKFDAGENVTGWRSLREYLSDAVISKHLLISKASFW